MKANRRNFVLGTPVGLAALLGEYELFDLEAAQTSAVHDPAALDFWTRGMGVSHASIASSGQIDASKGGSKGGDRGLGPSSLGSFDHEPVFLHYHEGDKVFIPADQLPKSYLLASGDTQVSTQMQRLRLNSDDNNRYAKYTSGGIYFELQQAQQASASAGGAAQNSLGSNLVQFASSIFAAFAPGTGGGGGGKNTKTASTKSTSTKTSTKAAAGGSFFLQGGGSGKGASAGGPIPLQNSKQAQSLALPNGAGKAAFSAFVKDPRKGPFGQFLGALASTGNGSSPLYAELLSIPMLAYPGLASIRSIVANLQLSGSSQQILMQSPPTDIATTVKALDMTDKPLQLRAGDYLVVTRDHPGITLDDINKFKVLDGFLVPKGLTSSFDVNSQTVADALPALSYLTLSVGVKATKMTCGTGA